MSARCGAHPDAAAVDTCARCGVFLCGACLELEGETPLCAACRKRSARPPMSRFKKFSLVAGALLLGLVLLGVVLALK